MVPSLFPFLFTALLTQSGDASVPPPAAVQEAPDKGWSWRVVPYLFAANLEGTVDVGGTEVSTDVSFSDLVSDLDFGSSLLFEGQHGRWGFSVDSSYIRLGEDGKGSAGVAREAEVTTAMLGLTGFYRVSASSPFDVGVGLRYMNVDQEIRVGGVSSDGESSLLDAVVSGRATWPFAGRWRFGLYGDVGTGDSDLTWQGVANLGYHFGNWGLDFGYRLLAYEFEDGSDELDITEEGWQFGFEYRF